MGGSNGIKTVHATFVGTNSLGYERGKRYVLEMQGKVIWRKSKTPLDISVDNGRCAYETITSFFDNWIDVTYNKESYRDMRISQIVED